jgi:hypothetical protein
MCTPGLKRVPMKLDVHRTSQEGKPRGGTEAQRGPRGPEAQRPRGSDTQRPRGPEARRPKNPKAQRPRGPERARGPEVQRGPRGPERTSPKNINGFSRPFSFESIRLCLKSFLTRYNCVKVSLEKQKKKKKL